MRGFALGAAVFISLLFLFKVHPTNKLLCNYSPSCLPSFCNADSDRKPGLGALLCAEHGPGHATPAYTDETVSKEG